MLCAQRMRTIKGRIHFTYTRMNEGNFIPFPALASSRKFSSPQPHLEVQKERFLLKSWLLNFQKSKQKLLSTLLLKRNPVVPYLKLFVNVN